MQVLMLTPDGRIINALAGFIGPEELREELEFGLSLLERLDSAPDSAAKELVSKAHTARAAEFANQKSAGLFGPLENLAGGFMAVGSRRSVEDHRFVAQNPLLPIRSFSTAMMVGDAKSAFVWHTSGNPDPQVMRALLGGSSKKQPSTATKRRGNLKQ